jgi:RNA polymerase sigma factor (sigma-70 family)
LGNINATKREIGSSNILKRDQVEEQALLQEMIEGCRKGDPKWQKVLYETFSGRLFGVCLAYSADHADAEDTLHDGFMKIFTSIGQFQGEGSFEGWMRRIMVNTALEKYRRATRMMTIADNIRSQSSARVEHILEEISATEIMEAVQSLSPQYRLVFLLYAVEGYNHKEIGQQLSISEGTSKSNLSRARSILQERLKHTYQERHREAMIIPLSK